MLGCLWALVCTALTPVDMENSRGKCIYQLVILLLHRVYFLQLCWQCSRQQTDSIPSKGVETNPYSGLQSAGSCNTAGHIEGLLWVWCAGGQWDSIPADMFRAPDHSLMQGSVEPVDRRGNKGARNNMAVIVMQARRLTKARLL